MRTATDTGYHDVATARFRSRGTPCASTVVAGRTIEILGGLKVIDALKSRSYSVRCQAIRQSVRIIKQSCSLSQTCVTFWRLNLGLCCAAYQEWRQVGIWL